MAPEFEFAERRVDEPRNIGGRYVTFPKGAVKCSYKRLEDQLHIHFYDRHGQHVRPEENGDLEEGTLTLYYMWEKHLVAELLDMGKHVSIIEWSCNGNIDCFKKMRLSLIVIQDLRDQQRISQRQEANTSPPRSLVIYIEARRLIEALEFSQQKGGKLNIT